MALSCQNGMGKKWHCIPLLDGMGCQFLAAKNSTLLPTAVYSKEVSVLAAK